MVGLSSGRGGKKSKHSKMMRHLLGFDYTYESDTTDDDSSDFSD